MYIASSDVLLGFGASVRWQYNGCVEAGCIMCWAILYFLISITFFPAIDTHTMKALQTAHCKCTVVLVIKTGVRLGISWIE